MSMSLKIWDRATNLKLTKRKDKFKKARLRKASIKHKYNLTESEYLALYVKQNGSCAICGSKSLGKTLSIDHCHKTDNIRGLLCNYCNTGLGMFKDNIGNLIKAIGYLNKRNLVND